MSNQTGKRIKKKVGTGNPVAIIHSNRKRKDCPGMMVQLDPSPYKWMEGGDLNLHGP